MSRPRVTTAHTETAHWMARVSDAARAGALGEDGYRLACTLDALLAGHHLSRALGLTTAGNCEPLISIAHRDAMLRRLAHEFHAGESAPVAAREIASRLRRYEASAWKIDQALSAPSAAMQGTERELQWRILKGGCGAISAKTISRALDINPPVFVHGAPIASTMRIEVEYGQGQNGRVAKSQRRRR